MTIAELSDTHTSQKETYGLVDLLTLIAPLKFVLIKTVAAGILANLGLVGTLSVGAWLTGHAVAGFSTTQFYTAAALIAGLLIITAFARWQQSFQGHDLAFALVETLQVGVYDGIERSAPRYVLGQRSGDLASTAIADSQLMEWFYAHLMSDYVGAAIVPIAVTIALAFIAPPAAIILAIFIPVIASVPFWLAQKAEKQGKAMRRELGELNAGVVESIQGLREIATFNFSQRYQNKLAQKTETLSKYQHRYGARSGLEQAAIDTILTLAMLSVAITAIYLASQNQIEQASVPLVIVLAGVALSPLIQVTETARKIGELRAGAARILTIFHQKAQVPDEAKFSPRLQQADIAFDNVRFTYEAGQASVLNGLSFQVHPGETVALVGKSGAGKSTCISLLMRFWDTTSGAVHIGGHDVRSIPLRTLREWLTIVPQDTYLFNMSIRENIRLGAPHATDEEVAHAAKKAQADDFIHALPQGYDTICGERGARLSGGQRQRIAIARAFIRNTPVLLMDEAVSNLDPENEKLLQNTLHSLREENKTILIVAHRLSTIRTADRIIMLENGVIVESGSHEELVTKGGAYCNLIASASDGVLAD